jgi:hypothetical protein
MHSHLSLIGSIVLGGVFLLNLFGFHSDLREHSFLNTNDVIVQQNALAITELLESDLRQIGTGVDSAIVVTSANAQSLSYLTDLGGNGSIDVVAYSLSNPDAAADTPNPRDRILYRAINGATQLNAAMGVTDFRLKYFDHNGNLTNDTAAITTIEMTLELESTVPYDGKFAHFFWRKKITPPNLLRL